MYCYYKCSVALPHGAAGWSAVCDCGIPVHTRLLFTVERTNACTPLLLTITHDDIRLTKQRAYSTLDQWQYSLSLY